MPRRLRVSSGGYAYHVLNRAVGRMRIFGKERDFEAFEEVIEQAKARLPMRVLAWCVMPNHWHFVLWPRGDGDLSEFMRWLTVTHTQRWHAAHRTAGTGPLYQGRFKSFPIQEDDHLWTVLRYVERNPLRANLVEAGRCVAMVESLASRPRQQGRAVGRRAGGAAATLAATRSDAADRSGVGGVAAIGGARFSVWRGVVAGADGEATGPAIHVTSAWSAVAKTINIKTPDPFTVTFPTPLLFSALAWSFRNHADAGGAGGSAGGELDDEFGLGLLRHLLGLAEGHFVP